MCLTISGNKSDRFIRYEVGDMYGMIGIKSMRIHTVNGKITLSGSVYDSIPYVVMDYPHVLAVIPAQTMQDVEIVVPVLAPKHKEHRENYFTRRTKMRLGAHISPLFTTTSQYTIMRAFDMIQYGQLSYNITIPVFADREQIMAISVDSSIVVSAFFILKPDEMNNLISVLLDKYVTYSGDERLLSWFRELYPHIYFLVKRVVEDNDVSHD